MKIKSSIEYNLVLSIHLSFFLAIMIIPKANAQISDDMYKWFDVGISYRSEQPRIGFLNLNILGAGPDKGSILYFGSTQYLSDFLGSRSYIGKPGYIGNYISLGMGANIIARNKFNFAVGLAFCVITAKAIENGRVFSSVALGIPYKLDVLLIEDVLMFRYFGVLYPWATTKNASYFEQRVELIHKSGFSLGIFSYVGEQEGADNNTTDLTARRFDILLTYKIFKGVL